MGAACSCTRLGDDPVNRGLGQLQTLGDLAQTASGSVERQHLGVVARNTGGQPACPSIGVLVAIKTASKLAVLPAKIDAFLTKAVAASVRVSARMPDIDQFIMHEAHILVAAVALRPILFRAGCERISGALRRLHQHNGN